MTGEDDLVSRIVSKAEKILEEYPLCNSCLGRLFAKYGVGLSNYDRGLSIKTILAFKLHAEYNQGLVGKEKLYILGRNSGGGVLSLYKKLFEEDIVEAKCFICGSSISRDLIKEISEKACELAKEYGSRTFVVGISMDKAILERELEILVKHGIETSESIRREFKREIGKEIKNICSLEPDFVNPDLVVIIKFDKDFKYEVSASLNPVFYGCRILKTGRKIPFYPRLRVSIDREYTRSIYEIIEEVFKEATGAHDIVIHGVGFEGSNTRILGSGADLVIEAKAPRRRIDPIELRGIVKSKITINTMAIEVESILSRNSALYMREISRSARKLYRVSVYAPGGVEPAELCLLERFFTGSEVTQVISSRPTRYPRVKTRRRKVYFVKTTPISNSIFEAIIMCDTGLSIRKLVECSDKDVEPCFSSVLSKGLVLLEIDLVNILK